MLINELGRTRSKTIDPAISMQKPSVSHRLPEMITVSPPGVKS